MAETFDKRRGLEIMHLVLDLSRVLAAGLLGSERAASDAGDVLLLAGVIVTAQEGKPLPAWKLSAFVGMPNPTTRRRLHALEGRGFVVRLPGGQYVAGPALKTRKVQRAMQAAARRVVGAAADMEGCPPLVGPRLGRCRGGGIAPATHHLSVPQKRPSSFRAKQENPQEECRTRKDEYSPRPANILHCTPMSILQNIIQTAASKPGFDIRTDTEETIRRITPQPQADIRRLSLRELKVNDILGAGPDVVLPSPTNPGTKTRIASDVIELNSRTVAAGAHIVLIRDAVKPIQDSTGQIHMVEQPAGFIVAESAPFALVTDGASVSDSSTPVHRALMDRSTAPTYMFRTVLTRRQQKSWLNGELEDGVLMAICMGLGRLVDKVLLDAIAADTPAAFTIGAAAARGLKVQDLSGLVGTLGTGATWRDDGELCVSGGIPAELTGDMTGTIVGDFGRSAVGLFEDIALLGQRTGTDGSMAVTCICNAQALLPVTGAALPFWAVS